MDSIRPMPDSDLDAFIRIAGDAYPGIGLVTADDRRKRVELLVEASNIDRRISMHGCYRDGRLIAGIRLHDYAMTLRGRQMLAGGGGFLAVDLPYKKEHIARRFIEYYFNYYLEKNAALAVLWPFRPDFYRSMGVGYGSKKSIYSIRPGHFPKGPTKEHVSWLTEDDLPAIAECYNRYAQKTNGMIAESIDTLRFIYFKRAGRRIVGVKRDGRIEGYLVFSYEKTEASSFIDNNLIVTYCLCDNRDALQELMTFLHTQDDQIHRIIFHTSDDNFHFLPLDPRNESRNVYDPVYHESHLSAIGIMYRVLSVRRLFQHLADSDFNGVTMKIKINIRDTFLPDNGGFYVLAFEKGRPSVVSGGTADVEISLDIADFTSLIMGAVDFRSLYAFSLADISDPALTTDINNLFATDHKPVCLTPF